MLLHIISGDGIPLLIFLVFFLSLLVESFASIDVTNLTATAAFVLFLRTVYDDSSIICHRVVISHRTAIFFIIIVIVIVIVSAATEKIFATSVS